MFVFPLFFWSKMCVLCMFYVDLELGGRKKSLGYGFFLIKTCYGSVTGNKQLFLRPNPFIPVVPKLPDYFGEQKEFSEKNLKEKFD